MLILLIFSFHSDSNRSRPRANSPHVPAKKLGPEGTIAKEKAERKEKSQKRLEKCEFFWPGVEITAENAALRFGAPHSNGSQGRRFREKFKESKAVLAGKNAQPAAAGTPRESA